jgi:hypothetical protein
MFWGLKRFHVSGQTQFVAFCCRPASGWRTRPSRKAPLKPKNGLNGPPALKLQPPSPASPNCTQDEGRLEYDSGVSPDGAGRTLNSSADFLMMNTAHTPMVTPIARITTASPRGERRPLARPAVARAAAPTEQTDNIKSLFTKVFIDLFILIPSVNNGKRLKPPPNIFKKLF